MTALDWSSLQKELPGKVRLAEPLSRHTSFHIGGPADAWVDASTEADLLACLAFAKAQKVALTLLAGGTNVLVRDGGIRGLVLSLDGDFEAFSVDGNKVRAGAAMNLALLARKTALAGLEGLEWAVGIPGSLGGGLVMNAGAHGGEMKQVVRRVGLVADGAPQVWSAEDCGFAYRHSRFKEFAPGSLVLTWAEMELKSAPVEELKRRMDEALAKRKASQPLGLPNAGCVFKNPAGDSAGRMIEACGLKGRRRGGAEISAVHANFVVNAGGAAAADVLGLMAEARAAVQERFGVALLDEVLVLGEDA
ncbi:MAG TPA: UDP-N-acetylmuramate dehydrogenase [bacterium]|jgi:UDP-N-acetylmuramate dehydrogenase|nr:UDP-N-acetylmuramate dehydrogenase [bacterium]